MLTVCQGKGLFIALWSLRQKELVAHCVFGTFIEQSNLYPLADFKAFSGSKKGSFTAG